MVSDRCKCQSKEAQTSEYEAKLKAILDAAGLALVYDGTTKEMLGAGGYCTVFAATNKRGDPLAVRVSTEQANAFLMSTLFRLSTPETEDLLPSIKSIGTFETTLRKKVVSAREKKQKDVKCSYEVYVMPKYSPVPVVPVPADTLARLRFLSQRMALADNAHGDLKPENVMWNVTTGYPVIIDWDYTQPTLVDGKVEKFWINPFDYPGQHSAKGTIISQAPEKPWAPIIHIVEAQWIEHYIMAMAGYYMPSAGHRTSLQQKAAMALAPTTKPQSTFVEKTLEELEEKLKDLRILPIREIYTGTLGRNNPIVKDYCALDAKCRAVR